MIDFNDEDLTIENNDRVFQLPESGYREQKANWEKSGCVTVHGDGSHHPVKFTSSGKYIVGIGICKQFDNFNDALECHTESENATDDYFRNLPKGAAL